MATYKIQFLSHLAKIVGNREITVELEEPATINKLLQKLQATYGEPFTKTFISDGTLSESIVMLVNGLNLKQHHEDLSNQMDLYLKPQDDIAFIVPFGGG